MRYDYDIARRFWTLCGKVRDDSDQSGALLFQEGDSESHREVMIREEGLRRVKVELERLFTDELCEPWFDGSAFKGCYPLAEREYWAARLTALDKQKFWYLYAVTVAEESVTGPSMVRVHPLVYQWAVNLGYDWVRASDPEHQPLDVTIMATQTELLAYRDGELIARMTQYPAEEHVQIEEPQA